MSHVEIHYEDSPDTVSVVVFVLTTPDGVYRMPVETDAPGLPARWFKQDPRHPNSGTLVDDVDQHRTLNELAGIVEIIG